MADKEQARAEIAALVTLFESDNRKEMSEQETRIKYILPLFRALGWNIERDLTAEENISRGFVDFGFYLNGVPTFYLETKRAAEKLERPEFMQQAINYSYLKGVTWAVLTDFKGLMVFNAEWETKDPIQARFLDLKYRDYTGSAFEDLWLLSKESLQAREIDQVAERFGRKARKEPITTLLFKQLTEWRRDLFNEMRGWKGEFWAQNPREVDNAVQKFLDRLIFIRTVEDRGVEPPRLMPTLRQYSDSTKKQKDLFADILSMFRDLDEIYNSNLFAKSALDEFLEIHNPGLLADIINGLYRAPGGFATYDFNAISADILGAVYEQYLGFKAQDPEGKQALDPRKQEKRKTQGIYYTPQFVVRYIVQQTLGKVLSIPSPAQSASPPHAWGGVGGGDFNPRNLRILDPACGSGSFLIEAFDVLDRWLATHGDPVEREFPRIRRTRILQENIYGVDLDEQAVEVTRLNLMLRAAISRDKLPLLTHIQHGNSLIDDPEIAGKAAFKWEEKFAEVMNAGGFDVVIGNPPYVNMSGFKEKKSYLQQKYKIHSDRLDLFGYFIELEYSLLKPNGHFGMIVSNKFMRAGYGQKLREYIIQNSHLENVVDLAGLPIFPDATVRTVIFTAQKTQTELDKSTTYTPVMSKEDYEKLEKQYSSLDQIVNRISYPIPVSQLKADGWNFLPLEQSKVLQSLLENHPKLIEYISPMPICMGIKPGLIEAFTLTQAAKKEIINKNPEAKEIIKPMLNGREIRRYHIEWSNKSLIYTYRGIDMSRYPFVLEYLERFRDSLEKRATKQAWYELQQSQFTYAKYMDAPKIIFPDIATTTRFAFDSLGYYGLNTTYFLPTQDLYLLGLLNSKAAQFYFVQVCAALEGAGEAYLRFFGQYLEGMPIPPAEKAQHERMVALVEQMLDLKRQHAEAESALDDRRHELAERMARVDREIDQLVYGLYGLTEDEIRIVEG